MKFRTKEFLLFAQLSPPAIQLLAAQKNNAVIIGLLIFLIIVAVGTTILVSRSNKNRAPREES